MGKTSFWRRACVACATLLMATGLLAVPAGAGEDSSWTIVGVAGRATVEDDADRAPGRAARAFPVEVSSLSLATSGSAVEAGGAVDLTATLSTLDGAFLDERTVFFAIDGPTGRAVETAITNLDGVASILGGLYGPGEYTVTARFLGDVPVFRTLKDPIYLPSSAMATFTVETEAIAERPTLIYLSSATSGTVDGFAFDDEDILRYDVEADLWELVFDGSRVDITGDLNGMEMISGPDKIEKIRMSFQLPTRVPGIGRVDDSDIVEFTPTGFGAATAGTFEVLLDGSDVGLQVDTEDIDAITSDPAGASVLSTIGSNRVPGTSGPELRGRDEDLLRLDHGQFGANSAGSFSLLFDGSAAGIATDDVNGAWIDPQTGDAYVSGSNGFDSPAVVGDGADVFSYGPDGFKKFFDGGAVGFGGQQIDALHIDLGSVTPVIESDPDYEVYVSTSDGGFVDGINFDDEDILVWNSRTRQWSKFFDGSAFGLADEDIDGADVRGDGSVAISLRTPFGSFDDSDVLLVNAAGEIELFVDGSTLGLTTGGEDVSAIAQSEPEVVVSTSGSASLPGAGRFRDEDLLALISPVHLFFDGSDVGLGPEDIVGASVGPDGLFLSVLGNFTVGGFLGDGDDIVRFSGTTGTSTVGSFEKLWDGDEHGFSGEQIDALHVVFTGA